MTCGTSTVVGGTLGVTILSALKPTSPSPLMKGRKPALAKATCSSVALSNARSLLRTGLIRYASVKACCSVSATAGRPDAVMIRNADTRAARQRSHEQIPAQDHSSHNSPRFCTGCPVVFARPNRHRAKYKAPNAGADSLKGASLPNQASTVHSRQHRHENGCPCEGYGPP